MGVTATFAVDLEDGTSGAANAAANSLINLEAKINKDVKALREMKRAMKQIQGGASVSVKAFRELQGKIDSTNKSIAENRSKFVELGGVFGKVAPKARKAAKATAGLGESLSLAGGPAAGLAGTFSRLGALLSNPIAIVAALAVAFVSLGAAIVGATAALLSFAVAQSDARRNEALQIEGLNTLRHRYGRTTASVEAMQAAIDRASDSTNVGRGQLARYSRQLSRAGLRGAALADAVEAMGIAQMVQGDRGAARFRAQAINARLAGRSVSDLAEAYRNRLGPIARRQMLGIDNQTQRLRRSLDRIFSGLRIAPFLSSLDEILSLFSQSTATGRALKTIVEALFQPMIDQVGVLGPVVRRFFQGMVIGALVITIALLRVRNALRDTFGGSELFANVDALEVALFAGVAAMAIMFGVAVGLTAIFVLWSVAIAAVVASFLILPALLAAAMAAAFALGQAVANFIESFDFAAFGRNIIDGLVNGITSGTARVVAAVTGLASAASSAFRSVLGIASPSSVFAGFGLNVSQGVSQGIDAGTPAVEDSVSSLVDVPTGGGLGGSVSISIGDVNIAAASGEGGEGQGRELAVSFVDTLASLLEGVGVEMAVPT